MSLWYTDHDHVSCILGDSNGGLLVKLYNNGSNMHPVTSISFKLLVVHVKLWYTDHDYYQ